MKTRKYNAFIEYLDTYRFTGDYEAYLDAEEFYLEYKALGGKREHKLMNELMRREEVECLLAELIIEEAKHE